MCHCCGAMPGTAHPFVPGFRTVVSVASRGTIHKNDSCELGLSLQIVTCMPLCQTVPKNLMSQIASGPGRTTKLWILSRFAYLLSCQSFAQLLPGIGPAWHSTALLDTTFATYNCMTAYGHFDLGQEATIPQMLQPTSSLEYSTQANFCRLLYTTYK